MPQNMFPMPQNYPISAKDLDRGQIITSQLNQRTHDNIEAPSGRTSENGYIWTIAHVLDADYGV